ncbi:MAG: Crp/Fnr family transcriptional regulator [Thalassovita sp.]|nr:Crp/Fnr family transcriptional regulator [Thalassovita sp.]
MNVMTSPWLLTGHLTPKRTDALEPKLFRKLTAPQKASLRQAFCEEVYQDGDPVPRDTTGIVLHGGLRESARRRDGTCRVSGIVFTGEVLLPNGPRTAGVQMTAMGETGLLSCGTERFAELMHDIPQLRLNFLEEIQDRICETRRWHVMLGRKTAAERVASLLFSFWQRQGCPPEMSLRLSREDLGQMLSLTFETVSRQIKAMEQAGMVALPLPSRVRILDPQRLLNNTTGGAAMPRHAA